MSDQASTDRISLEMRNDRGGFSEWFRRSVPPMVEPHKAWAEVIGYLWDRPEPSKIGAIKAFRNYTATGLREARDWIVVMLDEWGEGVCREIGMWLTPQTAMFISDDPDLAGRDVTIEMVITNPALDPAIAPLSSLPVYVVKFGDGRVERCGISNLERASQLTDEQAMDGIQYAFDNGLNFGDNRDPQALLYVARLLRLSGRGSE